MQNSKFHRLQIRLPEDCKSYLEAQARHNVSSQNSEIVRCIRAQMEVVADNTDGANVGVVDRGVGRTA